jgi:hypothetical protein
VNNRYFATFKVFTAVTTFYEVEPHSLVEVYRRFGGTRCLHFEDIRERQPSNRNVASWCLLGLLFDSKDRGSTFLRNVGKLLTKYLASHSKTVIFNRNYVCVITYESIALNRNCSCNFRRRMNVICDDMGYMIYVGMPYHTMNRSIHVFYC